MKYDVLIAEDDDVLRFYLSLSLSSEGIKCLEASNGDFALKAFLGLPAHERPRFMVLDQSMPAMGGRELVQELQRQQLIDDVQVIFYTGVFSAPLVTIEGKTCRVMHKPYEMESLVAYLRQTI